MTHSPVLRADGTMSHTPGHDPATGVVYLPPAGLRVPEIPQCPTTAQVSSALNLLLGLIEEFPWETEEDRVNFFGGVDLPCADAGNL